MEVMIVIGLLIAGLITGFAAGLFGIGGGTVLIPLLLSVFGYLGYDPAMDMHIAIATSLALIIPTAITSSIVHYRNQHLEWRMAQRWIPGVCIGVFLGVLLIHSTSAFWLKVIFAGYLLFCILHNLFDKSADDEVDTLPAISALLPLSTLIGCLSTLLGVGGGTFTTPVLRFFKYPLRHALAMSAFTGLFIGALATISIVLSSHGKSNLPPYSIGYVNWLVFLLITPTAIIGSPIGVFIAEKLTKSQLNKSYTVFLAVIFLLMLSHLL